jgi:hypothetical protein
LKTGWIKLLPWFGLFLFLLLPLYAVSIAFGIRSGIFDLADKEISGDEFKAFWAFVASGLATAATLIGLLFTKTHNERTADQLALDTAVKSLELLNSSENGYASKASVAGALSSLVHLGHPIIAMRTLDAAWAEDAVDAGTACWLISQVLATGSDDSKLEAADLLSRNAHKLVRTGNRSRGKFDWPSALRGQWPKKLPRSAKLLCIRAAIEVLLSRPIAWWPSYGWALALLDEVIRTETRYNTRNTVAKLLEILLIPYEDVRNRSLLWKGGHKRLREVRRRLSKHRRSDVITVGYLDLIHRVKEWIKTPDGKSVFKYSPRASEQPPYDESPALESL